jgi:hypothetical protein
MNRAALLLLLLSLPAAALDPYSLECEARSNPVGIDTARPRLGWKLKSPIPGDTQTAYQILAATSLEKLATGQADLWDSGRVASRDTLSISYSGAALQPFQRVFWKLRVWDAAAQPSSYTQPASFTTALLNPSQWRASWITHPDTSLRSGPLPLFRKQFEIDKPLHSAIALVSGAGFHEFRVNGAKVGDHVLAPAWTNYRASMLYEAFDITSLLQPGPNVLGVLLGNGFYNVAGGRYTKYTGSFGRPRLALMLRLKFQDGSTRDVTTDGTWRTHDGPVTFSCIFGGEDYDARLELPGWDRPAFDDSSWLRPGASEAPGGVMLAQSSPPIRVQHTYSSIKVSEPKPGIRVYDLGQNFAGWPRVTASGPAGSTVRMIPGELLNPDGLVTQRSSGGPNSFTFTLKGAGQETWAPRFTYYGFRYVQVEGDARVEKLEGQFIHLDAPRTGRFESSNQRFNRIHALIDAAIRSNLQHVMTDCPHREKLGWLEETYLMGPSILYNWDLRSFLPKLMRDMREAQLFNGLVPGIAPEYVTFRAGFRDSPEWGSAAVILPMLDWEWYGDRQALASAYPSMQAYVRYLLSQTKDGLLTYGLGDWYDLGPRPPGSSQLTPQGVTATATLWYDLQLLQRAAGILGLDADARQYSDQAAATRGAFQNAFYQPAAQSYASGSQTSLAMPLALGIAPPEARAALTNKLVAGIRARGNHTTAGDIGHRYVLVALLEAGRADVVFDMANNEAAPSYAAQLAAGATSLTEAWDANPNSSHNHFMLGHLEEWFYSALAGIRPDPSSPGFTRVRIEPQPAGDVTWVKASLETPRGPVAVHWRIDAGVFHLTLDVPPGVTAQVRLPGGQPKSAGSGHHVF